MHKSPQLGRVAALGGLIAAWALMLGAQGADAATIHACVNRHSGSARIVGASAKCHRNEHKVSWNTTGPAGAPGASGAAGAAGTDGANGVGVDFATATLAPTPLVEGAPGVVVAAKTIPAGSYFVNAKTIVGAGKGKSGVIVAVLCEIVDTAGTPALVEPPGALDLSEWLAQLVNTSGSEWAGATTLAMQAQLTTSQPTTLALMCAPLEGGKEATFDAVGAQLSALQTTANK